MAGAWDEPHGVTAVLLPGDPDAAWDYVERQVAEVDRVAERVLQGLHREPGTRAAHA